MVKVSKLLYVGEGGVGSNEFFKVSPELTPMEGVPVELGDFQLDLAGQREMPCPGGSAARVRVSSSCSSDRFQLHFEGIFSLLILQLLGFFVPDSFDLVNQFCDLLLEFYQGRVALHFSELSLHL